MGETAGYGGKVYYRHAYLAATAGVKATWDKSSSTLALVGLSAAGFTSSDTVNIASTSGSKNVGDNHISSIAASVITFTANIASDLASSATAVINAIPGTELAGFYNWTINYGGNAIEATNFTDAGTRTYIVGQTGWTGTATKRYSSASSIASWADIGTGAKHVRFFLKYFAIPTASSVAAYLQGSAYITGTDTTTSVGGVVEQGVNFQGTGALTLVTKNNTWNT